MLHEAAEHKRDFGCRPIRLIAFIESKTFTKKTRKDWTSNAVAELKADLADAPDIGDVIPGGDGLRKVRRRVVGKGKRGGVRIIYFWIIRRDTILLLDLYRTADKAGLFQDELKKLISLKEEMVGKLK